jgi:outer membrane receptor protein involved in Fe transport
MNDSSSVTNPANPSPGVPTYNYVDLFASWNVTSWAKLRGGVTNMLDRAPPNIAGSPALTNTGVYDTIGRTFNLGLTAKF